MLEVIAAKAPAILFYAIAAVFGLMGLFLIWMPLIGLPLLSIGYVAYLIATIAKRKAREHAVRRQL